MADVIVILCARMITPQMPSYAHVKLVIQIQVLAQQSSVKVLQSLWTKTISTLICTFLSDSCQVNNGGCDTNAVCSHDTTTNAVKCTCKTGYTNTGTGSTVVCTDSCQVNNGGCDPNAACSHDAVSNVVVCTCKTGYTNTGANSTVVCTGNI